MSAVIRRLAPAEFRLLRQLRIRALSDAPSAFGSTYERERAFTDGEWRVRLRPDGNPAFVWEEDGDVSGLVIAAPDAEDEKVAHLLAMWVSQGRRGTGVGDALVRHVLQWARYGGMSIVRLNVTEGNAPAEQLYQRHGFERTGRTLERQRDLCIEIEMECRLVP